MDSPAHLNISDYDYDLPESHIPYFPEENRENAKLLVYKSNSISTHIFKNIAEQLPSSSVLIFNNTKVIQARLHFKTSTNATVELFCLEPDECYGDVAIAMAQYGSVKWKCLVGNLRKWKDEFVTLVHPSIEIKAKILEKNESHVNIEFTWDREQVCFSEVLGLVGSIPIPPYFKRETTELDTTRYQTVYAQHKGSVAAPTAGLHFTDAIVNELHQKHISTLEVTLHVGAGTFMPVKSEKIGDHVMHAEWIDVSVETIKHIYNHTQNNIIPVGTTSLRTVETLYWMGLKAYLNPIASLKELEIHQWDAYHLADKIMPADICIGALLQWMHQNDYKTLICKTQILIAPPYKLKIAKGIITNFHQPKSTLLLLISAIIGDSWKEIYNYALKNNFRFLSYGDSSLLLPKQ